MVGRAGIEPATPGVAHVNCQRHGFHLRVAQSEGLAPLCRSGWLVLWLEEPGECPIQYLGMREEAEVADAGDCWTLAPGTLSTTCCTQEANQGRGLTDPCSTPLETGSARAELDQRASALGTACLAGCRSAGPAPARGLIRRLLESRRLLAILGGPTSRR